MVPPIPPDKVPRPAPGLARKRAQSQDDLALLRELDAREPALRAAQDQIQRERAARLAAEQRQTGGPYPPPVQAQPLPSFTKVEIETATEAALLSGHRWGARVGPKIAWVLGAVLALGAVGGAGVIGGNVALNPRPARQENLEDARTRLALLEEWRDSVELWQRGDYADRGTKEALVIEWACKEGFQADGLKCDEVKERVRQLRRDDLARWPELRKPPKLPAPKAP